MHREVFVSLILFLAAHPALGQQSTPAINYNGPGVDAPVLTPPSLSVSKLSKCRQIDGLVKLDAVVDQSGIPHGITVISSDNTDLNNFTAQWISEQRFKPGTVNGVPAAIPVTLTIGLHTCVVHTKVVSGTRIPELELSAHPFVFVTINKQPEASQSFSPTQDEKPSVIGSRIGAPIPTLMSEPEYSYEMKSRKLHGSCVLSVLVDAKGFPRDIQVVKHLQPIFDQSAIDAVKSWRFQPALKDGVKSVAVVVTVVVGYRYYEKQYLSLAIYLPVLPDVVLAHQFEKVISPPIPLNGDEVRAKYMPRSRVPGKCFIAAVIGTDGVPRDVLAVNNLDSSLGLDLIDAVKHMRFKPAMMNGTTPVPVGFLIVFKYTEKDMLREDSGGTPWWMNLLAQGAILALK